MRLTRLRSRRVWAVLTGWLVAVVLAVGVGVLGISLVGGGLTSGQGAPLDEDEVERELRSLRTRSAAPAGPAPAASVAAPVVSGRSFATRGGTVVADCGRILSMAPAQGWSVAEQDADEGEFQLVGDPAVTVEVELTCLAGQPQLAVVD